MRVRACTHASIHTQRLILSSMCVSMNACINVFSLLARACAFSFALSVAPILQVDGKEATIDNIAILMLGDGASDSVVHLTVKRSKGTGVEKVTPSFIIDPAKLHTHTRLALSHCELLTYARMRTHTPRTYALTCTCAQELTRTYAGVDPPHVFAACVCVSGPLHNPPEPALSNSSRSFRVSVCL